MLPIHPAANLFDPISADRLKALTEDIIKAKGVRVPIATWAENPESKVFVVDGVSRLDAAASAGILDVHLEDDGTLHINAPYQQFYGSNGDDPFDLVASLNVHRRHSTAEQKRKQVARFIKAQPEKSDRQIAAQLAVSPTTVGTVRSEMEAAGELSKLDSRVGADLKVRKQPAQKKRDIFQRWAPNDTATTIMPVAVISPTNAANPITRAWRHATDEQREAFVRECGDDIEIFRFSRSESRRRTKVGGAP